MEATGNKIRRLNLAHLPDGKGRIHFMVKDEAGPICVQPAELGPAHIKIPGHRYHLACVPESPWTPGGHYTGEPRAVSCPDCLATAECSDLLAAEPPVTR